MQYNKRLPCENWEYAQQDEWIKQNTMKHCPHIKWMGPCGLGWNFQWNDASWKLFDDPKEDVVVTTQAEDEQEETIVQNTWMGKIIIFLNYYFAEHVSKDLT